MSLVRRRCAMCDDWYDPQNAESVKIHRHPEPQSGLPREQWRRSGLPYERWVVETPEGREWNMPNAGAVPRRGSDAGTSPLLGIESKGE